MTYRLNDESIEGWLKGRGGWKRSENILTKTFKFASFRDTIVFVNRVAALADELDHHPDIDIRYSTVGIAAFRKSFKAKAKVPGAEIMIEGSNVDAASSRPSGGVVVDDARSRKGGLDAHAHDGGGAQVRRVDTEGDISVSSGSIPPKA